MMTSRRTVVKIGQITLSLVIFSMFTVHQRVVFCKTLARQFRQFRLGHSSKINAFHSSSTLSATQSEDIDSYDLPPVLKGYVEGFRKVQDDKLRYQQLLFLASKSAAFPDYLKIPENKVPGCLSTVYVHATMEDETQAITFLGDSDSQLTKGLVTMLVKGLSGCKNEEIQRLSPQFVTYANIAKSLTPGRNNGFLNMLNTMKKKSAELQQQRGFSSASSSSFSSSSSSTSAAVSSATSPSPSTTPTVATTVNNEASTIEVVETKVQAAAPSPIDIASLGSRGTIYQSIVKKLSMLQPLELQLEDESHRHAGHAGVKELGGKGETHFNLRIVAPCFQSLTLVQRHKMIYTLLAAEMSGGVHALSIKALAPSEVK